MRVVAKKKQGGLTVTRAHSDIQRIRATSHWRTIVRSRVELNNINQENNKPVVCFSAGSQLARASWRVSCPLSRFQPKDRR